MIQPYNPCGDGLPAKIWECLRRNPDFRSVASRALAFPSRRPPPKWYRYLLGDLYGKNRFAYAALPPVGSMDREPKTEVIYFYAEMDIKDARLAQYQANPVRLDPDFCWRDAPLFLRQGIEVAYDELQNPLPFEIALPKLHPHTPIKFESVREKVLNSYRKSLCERWWSECVVVTIPKFIRDTNHLRLVRKRLDSFVPRPRLLPHLVKKSSFLGSPKQWDAYLITEHFRPSVPGESAAEKEKNARYYATWYSKNKRDFEDWPESKLKSRIGLEQAKSYAKYVGHTNTSVEAIDAAIQSTYPAFTALPYG